MLDTSVFIARETGRPLAALPQAAETAVSIHGAAVATQDDDYDDLPGLTVLMV